MERIKIFVDDKVKRKYYNCMQLLFLLYLLINTYCIIAIKSSKLHSFWIIVKHLYFPVIFNTKKEQTLTLTLTLTKSRPFFYMHILSKKLWEILWVTQESFTYVQMCILCRNKKKIGRMNVINLMPIWLRYIYAFGLKYNFFTFFLYGRT